MANKEQLELLKSGVKAWNQWRTANPNIKLDLREADLRTARLSEVNFSEAKLIGANLSRANLSGADLIEANLSGANLSGADLIEANLGAANLSGANLSEANLRWAYLSGANLTEANLLGANLRDAGLSGAKLSGADLVGANLIEANLSGADLREANLRDADLAFTNLNLAGLRGADFTSAFLSRTVFGDTDLSTTKGLDNCRHIGPCVIDYQTLQSSKSLPLAFLRGCGLPDHYIDYLPSLINQPIQYYSCFISYSSNDEEFARRLYADLQDHGVRCWYAPEDMKIGDKIRTRIDEVIRIHQKLLLVLSERSIDSNWVEKEVETAFEKEGKNKGSIRISQR